MQGSQFPYSHIFSASKGNLSDQIVISCLYHKKALGRAIEWIQSQMVCLLHSRAVGEKIKHPQFRLGAYIVHTSDLKSYSRHLQTFLCSAIFNWTIFRNLKKKNLILRIHHIALHVSFAHCREEGCIGLSITADRKSQGKSVSRVIWKNLMTEPPQLQ